MQKNKEKPSSSAVVFWNIVVILCIFWVLEAVGWACFHFPQRVPDSFIRGLRHYYFGYGRHIIQVKPECGRYDPDLSYTLRQGTCEFSNNEFSTEYFINSLGARDDEASLAQPEIVVLGDSYAMGWGVEQEETFADILEKKSGKKVLNLGISSYGTVREMMILKKADLSKLRYLIIQYCPNDFEENTSFVEHQGVLPIMSQAEYDSAVQFHRQNVSYYPGKYVLKLLPAMFRYPLKGFFFEDEEDVTDPKKESELFLSVLKDFGVLNQKLHIIVFEADELAHKDSKFYDALKKSLQSEAHFNATVEVVDISKVLDAGDYFLLDSHFKASGHQKIADTLAEMIQ